MNRVSLHKKPRNEPAPAPVILYDSRLESAPIYDAQHYASTNTAYATHMILDNPCNGLAGVFGLLGSSFYCVSHSWL